MLLSIIMVFKEGLEGQIVYKPTLTEKFVNADFRAASSIQTLQRAVSRFHGQPQEETPFLNQYPRKRFYAMYIHKAFEISGESAINGMTDEARSLTKITRNIDLEAADWRTTRVKASGSTEEPKERTIFPLVSLARGSYSLAEVPVTLGRKLARYCSVGTPFMV